MAEYLYGHYCGLSHNHAKKCCEQYIRSLPNPHKQHVASEVHKFLASEVQVLAADVNNTLSAEIYHNKLA